MYTGGGLGVVRTHVRLFDFEKFPDNINAINEAGGISISGKVEGFAKLDYCGFDIDQALEDCDMLFVVGPAYSTQPFGEACKGKLERRTASRSLCQGLVAER